MNFPHLNFGNNFVSMHQFSTATKVVGSVQQNGITFIPATSTQHYHSQNHSNNLSFPNNVQVTAAVIQHQHHYQDACRALPINQSVTSHSVQTTSTSNTAAQTQWTTIDTLNRIPNDSIKINISNFPNQATHVTQTMQKPPKTILMKSVGTMTDLERHVPVVSVGKISQKDVSEDSDDSSKSSNPDNPSFQKSVCSNSCSKINLKSNASAMAEYLNRLEPTSIPQHIQEFLQKHNIKVDLNKGELNNEKKDAEDKIKPEIRLSTALDGSVLYCCSECHMAYPHKELLERHLFVHKAERKFECNVCGACLKRKEHLDQHKRGHSEERPFVCEICCKGFKRNEHLRRHIVIHSGDKNHVCPQCGKAFSRKDHLHKHYQTHVGKRAKAETNRPPSPSPLLQLPSQNKPVLAYPTKQVLN